MIPAGFTRALDGFEAVAAAVPPECWGDPSPCEGWCAADVVAHVIGGLRAIQARAAGDQGTAGGRDPNVPADQLSVAGADPLRAWQRARADTIAALGPEAFARPVPLAWGSDMSLYEFVERYPLEILVHTWDLAEATGQSAVLDPDLVRAALASARQFAPAGRAAGLIGPEREVSDDADDRARLLALFGRG
jgi:uncharacterized protein (TIGR03086 family)